MSVTEMKVYRGRIDQGEESCVVFEGLRRTGVILKDFQKEQRGQLLEDHRSLDLMFPGKVVVWVI